MAPTAALTAAERSDLIDAYAAGAERLRAAYEAVPEEARRWKPSPGDFSPHEVVCHCADSETNSHARIRFLVTEPSPIIQGYDEELWAKVLDYDSHPAEPALATVAAVRANTVPLLRRLTDAQWGASGRHSQSGFYAADDWLRIYAAHCEDHARQIESVHAAWLEKRRKGPDRSPSPSGRGLG